MKTSTTSKTRVARFEGLEDRRMMSADGGPIHLYPTPLNHNDRGGGYVEAPVHTGAMTAGPAAGRAVLHQIAVTEDHPRGIVKPTGTPTSIVSSHAPCIGSAEPQTDGIGSFCESVWTGVKRVVSHAYDQVKAIPLVGSPLRKIDLAREASRFAGIAQMDIASLQPGDVILCCSIGGMEGVIQAGTASRFNHAALYVGNGMVIDATNCYGISRRPLADVIGNRCQVFVMRDNSLTASDRLAVVRHAEKFLGGTYSMPSAVGGGTIKHVPGKDTNACAKMCSELVWDSYFNAMGGKRLTAVNLPTPGDLALSSQLSVVGRLV